MLSKEEYLEMIQPVDEEDTCPCCGCYAEGGVVGNCINQFCPSLGE